jgi:hypothetical protein
MPSGHDIAPTRVARIAGESKQRDRTRRQEHVEARSRQKAMSLGPYPLDGVNAASPPRADRGAGTLVSGPMSTSDASTPIVAPRAAGSSPLAAGLRAVRRFWRPFLLIQSAALLLVVAYHGSDAVRAACATAARWKAQGGLPFSALVGAIAGGLLPELAKLVAGRGRAELRGRGGTVAFNVAFFAFDGILIDRLYRFEAVVFGRDARLAVVAAKVAFDQFVFSPLWSVAIAVLFLWRARRFSFAATAPALGRGFLRARVLPLIVPNWCFWIPMVSIIYALPVALQFLLFVLVLAAWSLIMVFIAEGDGDAAGR